MSRLAAFLSAFVILLAGCSGGSSVPSAQSSTQSARGSTSGMQLEKYQIPIVTDPMVQSLTRKNVHTEISFGGIPAFASILDASNFSPGSQVNVAITEIDAMAAGVAYPIVQFTSPVVVNVLNYQTSALALGSNTIPAIPYDGVQYIVDPTQSNVVTNGQSYPMVFGTFANRAFTPSGGGLASLFFPAPVDASTASPSFVIDFDTAQWIDLRNGVAEVGPQGGGTVWPQSAVINGTIVNAAGQPVSGATVAIYDPSGTLARATISGSDGTFELHALYAGSYSMVVYNAYAPQNADDTLTATGNDPVGASIAGPSITVPAGYRLQVGTIQD